MRVYYVAFGPCWTLVHVGLEDCLSKKQTDTAPDHAFRCNFFFRILPSNPDWAPYLGKVSPSNK